MRYKVLDTISYSQIDKKVLEKIKCNHQPLVCLSGTYQHPKDFAFLVFDGLGTIRAKFADLDHAREYAEFLSDRGVF